MLSEAAIGVLGLPLPHPDRATLAQTASAEPPTPLLGLLYGGTPKSGSSCCGATALAVVVAGGGGGQGPAQEVGTVNGKWCQCMHSRFAGVEVALRRVCLKSAIWIQTDVLS